MVDATDSKPNDVLSEDDEEYAVVGLDLELADLSRFNALGFPSASTASGTGRSSTRSQGKRGPDSARRSGGFHRKDRLFFAGPPPPVPATETSELDAQNFLVVANLHWIISDADIWDGGCAYGPVRGVHVLEEPFRKKSEGVALVEFVSPAGPQNAYKDSGRAWAVKQFDRPVHLHAISDSVLSALQAQVAVSEMEDTPHWTRTAPISSDLVTAVLACAGKTPTIVSNCQDSGIPQETAHLAQSIDKTGRAPEGPILPLAIQALIDELKESKVSETT